VCHKAAQVGYSEGLDRAGICERPKAAA